MNNPFNDEPFMSFQEQEERNLDKLFDKIDCVKGIKERKTSKEIKLDKLIKDIEEYVLFCRSIKRMRLVFDYILSLKPILDKYLSQVFTYNIDFNRPPVKPMSRFNIRPAEVVVRTQALDFTYNNYDYDITEQSPNLIDPYSSGPTSSGLPKNSSFMELIVGYTTKKWTRAPPQYTKPITTKMLIMPHRLHETEIDFEIRMLEYVFEKVLEVYDTISGEIEQSKFTVEQIKSIFN